MQYLKNVSVKFKNKTILDNISLQTSSNKIAIIGVNGSGKSTILNLLAKELKANEGNVFLLEKFTYFFQNFSLFEHLTLQENMQVFIHKDWNEDLANHLGLYHYKDKKASQCSDGELQRVIICMAILDDNKFLLLDEPTKHLDDSHKKIVLELLQKLDKTVFITIHEENLDLIDGFEIYQINRTKLILHCLSTHRYETQKIKKENKTNFKASFKNLFFYSRYFLFIIVSLVYFFSNCVIHHFNQQKINPSIIQQDMDLQGVSADLFHQNLPISATYEYQEMLQKQMNIPVEINYTELFLSNQEGFFLKNNRIHTIYPIHSNLILKKGLNINFQSSIIQCYINDLFKDEYKVKIHDKGTLNYVIQGEIFYIDFEIVGIVNDLNVLKKFYISNKQVEIILSNTIINHEKKTLLKYIQSQPSYFINYFLYFNQVENYLQYKDKIMTIDNDFTLQLQCTLYQKYQEKIKSDQQNAMFYSFFNYFIIISFIIFLLYFLYDFTQHFYLSLCSLKKLQHCNKCMIIYFLLLFIPLILIQICFFKIPLLIFNGIYASIFLYLLFFKKVKY